jgi:hypothetical protein
VGKRRSQSSCLVSAEALIEDFLPLRGIGTMPMIDSPMRSKRYKNGRNRS